MLFDCCLHIVATGMCLPSRCLTMNVYSDFTIPAFRCQVMYLWNSAWDSVLLAEIHYWKRVHWNSAVFIAIIELNFLQTAEFPNRWNRLLCPHRRLNFVSDSQLGICLLCGQHRVTFMSNDTCVLEHTSVRIDANKGRNRDSTCLELSEWNTGVTCSSKLAHVQRSYDVSACSHNKITDIKSAYVHGRDNENRRHDMLYSL
jgi:hypothetical protein